MDNGLTKIMELLYKSIQDAINKGVSPTEIHAAITNSTCPNSTTRLGASTLLIICKTAIDNGLKPGRETVAPPRHHHAHDPAHCCPSQHLQFPKGEICAPS